MDTIGIIVLFSTIIVALVCSWLIFSPIVFGDSKNNKSMADEQL